MGFFIQPLSKSTLPFVFLKYELNADISQKVGFNFTGCSEDVKIFKNLKTQTKIIVGGRGRG